MIKFKNTEEKEFLDDRLNSLGFFTIRLIINNLIHGKDGIKPEGFYYRKDNDGNDVVLRVIDTPWLSSETIATIESQLGNFDNHSILDANMQRIKEFIMIKLQSNGLSNYGLNPDNWIEDED